MSDDCQRDLDNPETCAWHGAAATCAKLVAMSVVLWIALLVIPWLAWRRLAELLSGYWGLALQQLVVMTVLTAVALLKRRSVALMAVVFALAAFLCAGTVYWLFAMSEWHARDTAEVLETIPYLIGYPLAYSIIVTPPLIGIYAALRALLRRK